ncbi:galactokinase [Mycoemilia scoparia]|uniref:Galactokinase n=1 Tax=Mycoemilia scoparia TaxID=417184 RepID=A0A9W7ZZ11_9FUNG|nr:galactokinase [Mycoemilia scoparia]
MRIGLGILLTGLLLASSLKKKSLSTSGRLAATFVGLGTFTNDNLMFTSTLLIFFISSSFWTKYGASIKKKIDADYVEGGQRNAAQVLCNGLIGTLISIYYQTQFDGMSPKDMTKEQNKLALLLMWANIGFYACCAADTWGSELGTLSQSWPVLITSFKSVPPGTNGGISKLGLMASFAGGAAVGLAADVFLITQYFAEYKSRALPRIPYNMVASFVGLAGSLIDSLLGAVLQASYLTKDHKVALNKTDDEDRLISGTPILTNNQVNVLASISTTILSGFISYFLFGLDKRHKALILQFNALFGTFPDFIARAPGRVNIIGEHIDYCGLPVFPMAIECDCLIAVKASDSDSMVKLHNVNNKKYESCEFEYSPSDVVEINTKEHKWSNYFKCGYKGAIEAIGNINPKGMLCLLDENIPPGAGLSSSSALVCCATLATMRANGKVLADEEIVKTAVASERYVGVNGGGIMAKQGAALFIEFQPRLQVVETLFPKTSPGICFIVADTMVVSDKAVTAPFCYNLRVVETRVGALILAKHLGVYDHPACRGADPLTYKGVMDTYFDVYGDFSKDEKNTVGLWIKKLKEMIEAIEDAFDQFPEGYTLEEMAGCLDMTPAQLKIKISADRFPVKAERFQLLKRARHVYNEALRVVRFRQVCDAFNKQSQTSDTSVLGQLGDLMNESQDSCRDLYDCSCPEIDELCSIARGEGSLGSRLTGAGWGGCTVHLILDNQISDFISAIKDKFYKKKYPNLTEDQLDQAIFATRPGSGAVIM